MYVGDMDLLAASASDDVVWWFENMGVASAMQRSSGTGTIGDNSVLVLPPTTRFSNVKHVITTTCHNPSDIAVGDFDADGDAGTALDCPVVALFPGQRDYLAGCAVL